MDGPGTTRQESHIQSVNDKIICNEHYLLRAAIRLDFPGLCGFFPPFFPPAAFDPL